MITSIIYFSMTSLTSSVPIVKSYTLAWETAWYVLDHILSALLMHFLKLAWSSLQILVYRREVSCGYRNSV